MIVAYTDGACSGNPGPGGWAWAVEDGPQNSGHEPHTTNQRMEVFAALDAVATLLPDHQVNIVSDSKYVVDCFNQRWYAKWERNGYQNSKGDPVANQDLWKPFVNLVKLNLERVSFTWVKGHSSDPMNDLVDRLAVSRKAG